MTASARIVKDAFRDGWRATLTIAGRDYWPKHLHPTPEAAEAWATKWAADRRVDDFTIQIGFST